MPVQWVFCKYGNTFKLKKKNKKKYTFHWNADPFVQKHFYWITWYCSIFVFTEWPVYLSVFVLSRLFPNSTVKKETVSGSMYPIMDSHDTCFVYVTRRSWNVIQENPPKNPKKMIITIITTYTHFKVLRYSWIIQNAL